MVFKIHMDLKTFVFAAGARIPMGVCERPRVGPTVGRGVHLSEKRSLQQRHLLTARDGEEP